MEELIKLAFQYRETKLWKKLWDNQLFGLELSDGQQVSISIMGGMGILNGVAIYVGEDGLYSYLAAQNTVEENLSELLMLQNRLEISLVERKELDDEEAKTVMSVKKQHKIRVSGKNAWPLILKYESYKMPWKVKDTEDIRIIDEVLNKLIEIANIVKILDEEKVGKIFPDSHNKKSIPIIDTVKGNVKKIGSIMLPKYQGPKYEVADSVNELKIQKVKQSKTSANLVCDFMMLPEPIQDEPNQPPYFPFMLNVLDNNEGLVYGGPLVKEYFNHANHIADQFLDIFIDNKIKPEAIRVMNRQTLLLVNKVAEKLGVSIYLEDYNEVYEAFITDFYAHFMNEEMDDSIMENKEMLLILYQMSDSEFLGLPPMFINTLKEVMRLDELPQELMQEFKRKITLWEQKNHKRGE